MNWNIYDSWVIESTRNLSFRVKQNTGENDAVLRGCVLLRQGHRQTLHLTDVVIGRTQQQISQLLWSVLFYKSFLQGPFQ